MSKSIQGSKNMVYSQNPEREEIRSGGDWAKKGDFKQERDMVRSLFGWKPGGIHSVTRYLHCLCIRPFTSNDRGV